MNGQFFSFNYMIVGYEQLYKTMRRYKAGKQCRPHRWMHVYSGVVVPGAVPSLLSIAGLCSLCSVAGRPRAIRQLPAQARRFP